PETERDSLLGPLERNLPDLAHRKRFDWLYRANPAGPAWTWFAHDDGTNELVGVASVFPRAFWIGGRVERCGQVGDFAIDSTHRSLGPAIQLQRATLQLVDRGALAVCYDCPPGDKAMATFRRLGMEPTCRTHNFARPLRAEGRIARRLGGGLVARTIATLANGALWLRSRRRHGEAGVEIEEHTGRFGDEFSALDREVGGLELVRSRRSAEDLNWRYRDDPIHHDRVLTARREGELQAFVVVRTGVDDALIVDLFGHLSRGLATALVDSAAALARSSGAQTLRITVGNDQDGAEIMRRAGFWSRGEGPSVVAYTGRAAGARSAVESSSRWWVRHIDLLT
ncbi:MAG: hypothetical protein ACREKH_05625, partial [Candidatus Rokuibacteriota bacterium]